MVNRDNFRREMMLAPSGSMGRVVHGQITLEEKLNSKERKKVEWQPLLPTRLGNITMIRGRKCILESAFVGKLAFLVCAIPFRALKPFQLRTFDATHIVFVGPNLDVPTCDLGVKISLSVYNPTLKPITFKLQLDGFQVMS